MSNVNEIKNCPYCGRSSAEFEKIGDLIHVSCLCCEYRSNGFSIRAFGYDNAVKRALNDWNTMVWVKE